MASCRYPLLRLLAVAFMFHARSFPDRGPTTAFRVIYTTAAADYLFYALLHS